MLSDWNRSSIASIEFTTASNNGINPFDFDKATFFTRPFRLLFIHSFLVGGNRPASQQSMRQFFADYAQFVPLDRRMFAAACGICGTKDVGNFIRRGRALANLLIGLKSFSFLGAISVKKRIQPEFRRAKMQLLNAALASRPNSLPGPRCRDRTL